MTNQKVKLSEFDSIISRHGGNLDAAFDELEGLLAELQKDMHSMERHTLRDDTMAVASIAYRLRSGSVLRGIDLLHQSAAQIELSARKNRKGQLSAEIDLMRFQVELIGSHIQALRSMQRGQVESCESTGELLGSV